MLYCCVAHADVMMRTQVFAWTQVRSHLPVWLGVGVALSAASSDARTASLLRDMEQQWPFFQSTLNLIEMVLAKADSRVCRYYDELNVPKNLHYMGNADVVIYPIHTCLIVIVCCMLWAVL